MKKDFIKGIAVGCALSAAIGGTIALAEPVMKSIDAVYNDIKIVVDGKAVTPRDANGTEVAPFISDGTTYLPVRAVASALGKEVDWDGTTNTVYIGGKVEKGLVDMSTLEPYSGNSFFTGKVFKVRQKDIVTENALFRSATYILDGKYTSLEGMYVTPDYASSGLEGSIKFKNADTGEIIAEFTSKQGEKPIPIKVDLVGVDKLYIYNYVSERDGGGVLYNAYLTPINHQ